MVRKTFTLSMVLMLATFFATAQENSAEKSGFSIGADFQSRYVWRGLLAGGNSPSIQPTMSFNTHGFEVGVWGAFQTVGFNDQELDLYVSYTFLKDMLSVVVTDYCIADWNNFKYFDYRSDYTSHVLEAGITFNGTEKVPVTAGFYTNFYGNDKKPYNNKNAFSSYLEVAYNPSIKKWGVDFDIFAGCAIIGHAYGVEKGGFGFINLGFGATKHLKITDSFSLPIYTRLIFNPNANKAHLVFGTGISL